MPKLIKDKAIADNSWLLMEATDAPETVDIPADAVIIPLNVWQARKQELTGRIATLGVWLNSDQFADQLGEEAQQLPLVAVNFPGFMDGRGFSTARLLRERYGYSGELRATGSIIRDQLFFLQRCGFNSFDLPEGADLEAAMNSFNDFSETYQAAVDQPLPLFRRRA